MDNIEDCTNFDEVLNNQYVKGVLNKVSSFYKKSIDHDDLDSICMTTLWKCVQDFDKSKGAKFTTFLYNQLGFAFKNELKKTKKTISLQDIATDCVKSTTTDSMDDLIGGLPDSVSNILQQRYVYNMTMVEVGKANGYSRETARRRLKNAIKICKKKNKQLG